MSGLRGNSYVVVNSNGIFCLHPDNRSLGVDVSYVEKSLSDATVKSYRNEGEEFLASLSFHHPSVN